MTQKKTNEVTEGSMQFIKALINEHHADAFDVYLSVAEECKSIAMRMIASDPKRNR
jgi:uncharacterized protein (DUF305 family)